MSERSILQVDSAAEFSVECSLELLHLLLSLLLALDQLIHFILELDLVRLNVLDGLIC